MSSTFISLYLKAFIQNLVQNSTVVPEKIWFEFLYVHGIWPLTFNTHIPSLIQLCVSQVSYRFLALGCFPANLVSDVVCVLFVLRDGSLKG